MTNIAAWALNLTDIGSLGRLTGFSSTRLIKYATGMVSPTRSTENILRRAYRSVNYVHLRDAGFSVRAAREKWNLNPDQTATSINFYQANAEAIAHIYDKDAAGVLWGMSESDKGYEELTGYPTAVDQMEEMRLEVQAAKRRMAPSTRELRTGRA